MLVAAGFMTYRVLAARQSAAQAGAANLQTTTVVRGSIPATISTAGTVRSAQTAVQAMRCRAPQPEIVQPVGTRVPRAELLLIYFSALSASPR